MPCRLDHAGHRMGFLVVAKGPIVRPPLTLRRLRSASARIRMLTELVPTNDKLLTAVAFAKVKDGVSAPGVGTAGIPLQDRYHAGPFGFERAIHLPPILT